MTTDNNSISIFELASRKLIRFATHRGVAATEDLWNLPLTSKNGFDLDTIAKAVNSELKAISEESFVKTSTNPAKPELELKLELIKHVIAFKLQENANKAARADKAAKKEKLYDLLAKKEDAALENLSEDEIKKQLAALDD